MNSWLLILVFATNAHFVERYDYKQTCDQAAAALQTNANRAVYIPSGHNWSAKAQEQALAPWTTSPGSVAPAQNDPDYGRLMDLRHKNEEHVGVPLSPPR